MTDEEISAKVASIEGWTPFAGEAWFHPEKAQYCYDGCPDYATDWAWCGPLLKRDVTRLEWDTSKPSRKWMAIAKHGVLVIGNNTPQIAVCRAIIAAHDMKARGGIP